MSEPEAVEPVSSSDQNIEAVGPLPDVMRVRPIALAGESLGRMPAVHIPAALRPTRTHAASAHESMSWNENSLRHAERTESRREPGHCGHGCSSTPCWTAPKGSAASWRCPQRHHERVARIVIGETARPAARRPCPARSRTGGEVTVVFDAAEKADRLLVNRPKGVRVLYSPVGVIADDVIRQLVAAEPRGRPVVVVSSDPTSRALRGARGRKGGCLCGAEPTALPILREPCARRVVDFHNCRRRLRPSWGVADFPMEDNMSVHIDCDTCAVRGPACHDCVVTVLLGPPPELTFDDDEQRALEVLAGSGLVPPLRMVTPVSGPDVAFA